MTIEETVSAIFKDNADAKKAAIAKAIRDAILKERHENACLAAYLCARPNELADTTSLVSIGISISKAINARPKP